MTKAKVGLIRFHCFAPEITFRVILVSFLVWCNQSGGGHQPQYAPLPDLDQQNLNPHPCVGEIRAMSEHTCFFPIFRSYGTPLALGTPVYWFSVFLPKGCQKAWLVELTLRMRALMISKGKCDTWHRNHATWQQIVVSILGGVPIPKTREISLINRWFTVVSISDPKQSRMLPFSDYQCSEMLVQWHLNSIFLMKFGLSTISSPHFCKIPWINNKWLDNEEQKVTVYQFRLGF